MQTRLRATRLILANKFQKQNDDPVVVDCAKELCEFFAQEQKPEQKPDVKPIPVSLDWKLLTGQAITQDDVDREKLRHDALTAFEGAFGFGALPWSSNSVWEKFEKFVIKIYQSCPSTFRDYALWRDSDKGKYRAMSNAKIRMNPQMFMDTGLPEFESCKMYAKPSKPKARVIS